MHGVGFGNFRQLLSYLGLQQPVGHHPDVLRRDDAFQPVNSLLNQGSLAKETQYLFCIPLAAERPEARATPPCHDEAVPMICHHAYGFAIALRGYGNRC
jgi:hypothetical protein